MKRLSIFLITVALIAGMVGCDGNPPASENLEIRTWYDLDDVRDNLRGHHILMNDLNSNTAGYDELAGPAANEGKGWEPIGNSTGADYTFTGTFDGQGYEIRDLFINRPDESRVGLFRIVYEGGVIKNLGLTNVTVICRGMSGGLVGQNGGGDESDNRHAGSISNSYFSGNVTGDAYVGGLIGPNFGTVEGCYATGNVTGGVYSGGLIGANMGTVSKCYSTGSVTGSTCVGGLVGQNGMFDESDNQYAGTVRESYSTASVAGSQGVGGLAGSNAFSTVSNSYSTGSVSGNLSVGGLVAYNYEGTVSNSFWDTETSGQATSAGGTGKNTAEMQDMATFSGAGWNIIAVGLNETNSAYAWNIVDHVAYPFLSWQA
jgi:The GLUG motif